MRDTAAATPLAPYYYADGRRIPLDRAANLLAIRTQDVRAVEQALEAAPTSAPLQLLPLPEHNLCIALLPPGRPALSAEFEAALAHFDLAPVHRPSLDASAPAMVATGEIIFKLPHAATQETGDLLLEEWGLKLVRRGYPAPQLWLAQVADPAQTATVANALQDSGQVAFAQPNWLQLADALGHSAALGVARFLSAPHQTVDAGFGRALSTQPLAGDGCYAKPAPDPGFAFQWNLRKIHADAAWEISEGSPAVTVALLDDGCDPADGNVRALPAYDALHDACGAPPQPNLGHAAASAAVIAMRRNTGIGGVGVAPACSLLFVRIARRAGPFWCTTDAAVARGIRHALKAGADVLLLAYALAPSTLITAALRYAQTSGRKGKGCPIATAAGNDDAPHVVYPASLSSRLPGLMAVGATNEWDQRKSRASRDGEPSWGSNYGAELDVVAPGVHIYTAAAGPAGRAPTSYTSAFAGASAAAAHAAGLMALLLSVDTNLRAWEVKEIIRRTADDLGPRGRDAEHGYGRIHCRRALEAASKLWHTTHVTPLFLGRSGDCFMRVCLRLANPGINTVRVDTITLISYAPDGVTELDRFEQRMDGGPVLPPGAGDFRMQNLLLKAHGFAADWSCRWTVQWTFTYWRPETPGEPMDATDALLSGRGVRSTGPLLSGRRKGCTESARRPLDYTGPYRTSSGWLPSLQGGPALAAPAAVAAGAD